MVVSVSLDAPFLVPGRVQDMTAVTLTSRPEGMHVLECERNTVANVR